MRNLGFGAGLIVGLINLGVGGCGNNFGENNGINFVDDNNITSREECESNNGVWGMWNINDRFNGNYRCNLRTNDAGRRCYDQSDCDGMCITECFNADCHSNYGTCTEFEFVYGCFKTWENGRESDNAICVD